MATQIKLRRDTETNWTANSTVVLGEGEIGVNLTNGQFKLGDGTSTWAELVYFHPGSGSAIDLSAVTSSITPATDNTYDLGTPSNRWRHVYAAEGSIYIGDIKLSNDSGKLVVQQVTDAGQVSEAPVPDTPGVVTTDRIINGTHSFSIGTDGSLSLDGSPFTASANTGNYTFSGDVMAVNNSWTTVSTPVVSPGPGSVVWISNVDYISSAKLLIQVECSETGDDTGWHSQACEAIISCRGYANTYGGPGGDPQMIVYGVVHTSINPLVTFTVQRNPTTKFVEVVGTLTAAAGSAAALRIHSVEMSTRD